jgi:hypothetical protein
LLLAAIDVARIHTRVTLDHGKIRRQLFANAAIAASRVTL